MTIAEITPRLHQHTASLGIGALLAMFVSFWWMAREGRKGTRKSKGQRRVAYPRSVITFIRCGWLLVALIPAVAVWLGYISGTESILVTAFLTAALVLPIHWEVHNFEITWDGYWIYTKSFWRRPRRIPVNSVTSCRYHFPLQSYRMHTRKNGIIRVPIFTKGIPDLLELLPIDVPAYPPKLLGGNV